MALYCLLVLMCRKESTHSLTHPCYSLILWTAVTQNNAEKRVHAALNNSTLYRLGWLRRSAIWWHHSSLFSLSTLST